METLSTSALTTAVAVLAVTNLLALVLALAAYRALSARRRGAKGSPLPLDVAGLRGEVERLRGELATSLRHVAVVRYDAFGDMGGRLSWSMAVLDGNGDGVVLTSIYGRNVGRSYAKNVSGWAGDQQLSPEEETAIGHAKVGA